MGIEYCGYPNTPSSPHTLLIAYSFIIVLTITAIHTHHTRLFSLFLLHLFRAHSIRPKLCNVRAAHILRLYLLRAMNRRDNACANLIFAWVSKKFRLLTCPLRTAYRFRSASSDYIHTYIHTLHVGIQTNIFIYIYSIQYIHTYSRCRPELKSLPIYKPAVFDAWGSYERNTATACEQYTYTHNW